MRISIITISFNQARFLGEALRSVVGAGGSDVEHIVVDPGSSDGSRDIIQRHTPPVSAFFEPDKGPADGLNKGFSKATGEVLGFLNSDDLLCLGSLDFVEHFFTKHTDVDVVVGALAMIDANSRRRIRGRVSNGFSARDWAEGTALVLQQSTFFRRRAWELTRGFNTENHTCWDAELFVDMSLAGATFKSVRTVLGCFRTHEAAVSSNSHSPGNPNYARFAADMQRITGKVFQQLGKPRPGNTIRKLQWKLSPRRRALELLSH
jgi:glycosyltransferase involved in cell wall biosynthesis